MMRVFLILILPCTFLFFGCSKRGVPTRSTPQASPRIEVPSPACYIYLTTSDYYSNVPVILSNDKKSVIVFPDVKDIKVNGEFTYPKLLVKGYLLDNRGIGPDLAFLKYTYQEYYALGRTPSASELFLSILDADPLEVLYKCGNLSDYIDPVKELNELIMSGKINRCVKLK